MCLEIYNTEQRAKRTDRNDCNFTKCNNQLPPCTIVAVTKIQQAVSSVEMSILQTMLVPHQMNGSSDWQSNDVEYNLWKGEHQDVLKVCTLKTWFLQSSHEVGLISDRWATKHLWRGGRKGEYKNKEVGRERKSEPMNSSALLFIPM